MKFPTYDSGGCSCHDDDPDCDHCCACKCDCPGGWTGPSCNGKSGSGGCSCHDDDGDWEFSQLPDFEFPDFPELPGFERPELDFELPEVKIPQRVTDAFNELGERFTNMLGLPDGFMQFQGRSPDFLIYVENPIRKLGDINLPSFRAELRLDELAQQSWVSMLRDMLLFIVVCLFLSSIVTVLRQA